ncbi:MAG: single-strand binding protein [Parcubacteria group bacterium Gr01-1014_38]|nr:MAG: single-strand binding protein [Parcubacteria group bacterium Gr01-1014_38]
MARDLNKAMLIGRLVADPELRTTAGGQTVGNFRVATSRQWNDQAGQQQSQTEFSQVVAWGKLADLVNQYLRKGRQVFVEGRLQTRSWTDKNNQKHWRTEIVAETIIFLGSPAEAPVSTATAGAAEDVPSPPEPEPGTPAEPKAPAAVAAKAKGNAEELEEIRIEDIPF